MALEHILVFVAMGLATSLLCPPSARPWVLLISSLVFIYWLQPPLAIRWLDYSLPTATLALTVFTWWAIHRAPLSRQDVVTLTLAVAVPLLLTLPRYIVLPFEITSRPPDGLQVALVIAVLAALTFASRPVPQRSRLLLMALVILAGFVLIKTEPLAAALSSLLRAQAGQDTALADALDIGWLGYSYVAFRLLHTLRDSAVGLLPPLALRDYLTYVLFFPAFTAGPIDRAERFQSDLTRLAQPDLDRAGRLTIGLTRIGVGLFKKFIIADSLAIFALSPALAVQAESSGALWAMLYAYAFRLYFDFSGYTDIAIGVGILCGVTLSENFKRPYLQNNLTAFWQSWHITLSSWLRLYLYTPLSRILLRRKLAPDTAAILCTLATMAAVGLWHGFTLPFLVWGLWHGAGLSLHKLWSDRTRRWHRQLQTKPHAARLWHAAGMALTFHFVLLGWVWFALPTLDEAAAVFVRLLGSQP